MSAIVLHAESSRENVTTVENNVQSNRQRAPRKCSHCRMTGHIRNHCPIIVTMRSKLQGFYENFMMRIIPDYFEHKWTYTPEIRESWDAEGRDFYESYLTPTTIQNMNRLRDLPTDEAIGQLLRGFPDILVSQEPANLLLFMRVVLKEPSCEPERLFHEIHTHYIMTIDNAFLRERHYSSILMCSKYILHSLKFIDVLDDMLHSTRYVIIPVLIPKEARVKRLYENRNHVLISRNSIRNNLVNLEHSERSIGPRSEQLQREINMLNRRIVSLQQERERIVNSRGTLESRRIRWHMQLNNVKKDLDWYKQIPDLDPDIEFSEKKEFRTNECSICYDEMNTDELCETNCGHLFCCECIMKCVVIVQKRNIHRSFNSEEMVSCPYCRSNISKLHGNICNLFTHLMVQCEDNRRSFEKVIKKIGGRKAYERGEGDSMRGIPSP